MKYKKDSSIEELCIKGLCTDGGHHKQWYLEQILDKVAHTKIEKLKEENHWDEGIPP